MAEIFKFFNSAPGDERWHYASDFADYFGSVLSSGLISNGDLPVGLQVNVNAGTMTTNVSAGKALIKGYSYENTTPLTLTHSIPEQTLDRIDRIVLRLDLKNASRFIKVFVKEGVSALEPVPPILQRDQYIYELSLAQVRILKNTSSIVVSDIKDERADESLCGIVQSLITVPTSVFQQQFDTWFTSITDGTEQSVADWQIAQQQAFTLWFESVKGQLDGDVGAKLASDLAAHKVDNTHIFNVDVTYATNVYIVANALSFNDYLTVRFKAPNVYVTDATFKIGTDIYTALNADFEANEILIVTFDKVQKKVFFRRGGDLEPLLPSQLNIFTADKTGVSGQLKLDWTITDTTNLNDFLFVYKTTGYPENSKDGTAITASKDARTLLIDNLVDGTTYYIRAYPRNAKKQVQSSYKVASSSPRAADDVKRSPGPIFLAKGTMQEGYFGLVSSSELTTGDSLASLVGLSDGTSQFSTTNWLKFAYKGKVLFVAQKPIRYNLSWSKINEVGAVMGTKQVAIKSLNYKVRLLQGALTNPSENNATDRGAKGSEWNRLMLAVHEQVKNKNWAYPAYVESDIQDFGTDFTDADLITNSNYGSGYRSWCQETTKNNSSDRVIRGGDGVSISDYAISVGKDTTTGWRPVLELI